MKTTLVLLLSLLFGSAAFAKVPSLSFQGGLINAKASWAVGPIVSEESILNMEWTKGPEGTAFQPKKFKVVLWMPDMGHGSSPTSISETIDAQGQPVAGSYQVKAIYFLMGGLWNVKVTLQLEDGTEETQSFDVVL